MVKFIPLIGFLLIIIGRLFLPHPPNMFYMGLVEAIGLFVLSFGIGFKLYHQKELPSLGNILTALILISVTLVSWWVGYPDSKTLRQAEKYNRGVDQALTSVVETRRVPRNIRVFVPEADEQLEEKLSQAVELVRSGQVESAQDLIEELNPKIEVFIGHWNCAPAGCTFGTNTHVWTLNPVQYYAAWAIGTASLLLALIELKLVSFRKEDWQFRRKANTK